MLAPVDVGRLEHQFQETAPVQLGDLLSWANHCCF
jgi:hypothetical protein